MSVSKPTNFNTIYTRALKRKGSEQALQALLPEVLPLHKIVNIGDDRFLAEMTRCIFQAGFVWRVINQKWPNFEQAFFKFDPQKMLLLSPDFIDKLSADKSIVRNRQKIISVPQNAQFIIDIQHEHGSFSQFIQQWPIQDLVGLYQLFKKRGCRLGGMTGPRVLRNFGIDSFLLTRDVVHCLQQSGLDIRDTPSSLTDLNKIQSLFNHWQQESGLSFTHLSRICACSVGENKLQFDQK